MVVVPLRWVSNTYWLKIKPLMDVMDLKGMNCACTVQNLEALFTYAKAKRQHNPAKAK